MSANDFADICNRKSIISSYRYRESATLQSNGDIITTSKQSLGQDNVFTRVCHSVHRRCLCLWSHFLPGGLPDRDPSTETPSTETPSTEPPCVVKTCSTHPTGMHCLFNSVKQKFTQVKILYVFFSSNVPLGLRQCA